jgi:hypothetical protein
MTFFYDLNKKLDGIRATPEVKTQQLNEQASPLTQILNERSTGDYSAVKAAAGKDIGKPGKNFSKIAAGAAKRYGSKEAGERVAGAVLNKLRHPKEGMGFLGEKDVEEAYNPNSVGAENRRGLDASHAANLKKKAAAGDAKAQAALQHLKDKKERRGNDFNARMERESVGMDTGEPGIDSDLRDNILDVLNTILQGAIDGKEMIDTVADDLGDYFQDVKRSKDKTLRQAYKLMRRKGAEAEDNPEYMAQVAKQAIDLLSQQGMDEASKPDFLDIDKDGNTTEPMKSAARSARGMKEGGIPMTPKQQKFAKLAKPFDKITFADKIVGAKKEVDEMLGQVAADAMKKAVRGRDQDMEEASTGNAFDYKNFKQPEKQKPTSFVHKGTYGTEYDGDKEDVKAIATRKKAAVDAGQGSRGRGRPKKNASVDTGEVMKPDFSAFGDKVKLKPHTGKITKHKMVGEDDLDPKDQGEYDQEGDMAKDTIKTVVRHAHALEKILGDDDNLPEWVQSKLAKIESMMTAVDDYMQNQQDDETDIEIEMDEESTNTRDSRAERAGRKVAKDIEYDEKKKDGIHGKKRSSEDDTAERAGKKVIKDIEYDEKKDKKKKEVDETTSSGSVATSDSAAPKSSGGMSYGKGIYDSLNREVEGMISESMSINMSMNNDDNGPSRNLTVTATDEDATALASILRMAGMGGGNDHMPHMNNGVVQPDQIKVLDFDDGTDDLAAELSNELHGGHDSHDSEVCSDCGSSDCGCDDQESMDEAYGDTDETLNSPDWPTDAEGTEDAMMYSGGLNKPKSTGQTTIPVIASQQDRQHAYEDAAALRRMMEMAGLPVSEAAPPVKLATPQDVPEPVSPASAAPGKKPVVKPVTKSATPQDVPEPVKPVKEDKMAQSLMRELHNFKY